MGHNISWTACGIVLVWLGSNWLRLFKHFGYRCNFHPSSFYTAGSKSQTVGFVLKCIDFTGEKPFQNSNEYFWSCTKKSHVQEGSFKCHKALWAPEVLRNLGTLQVIQKCLSPFCCCLLCGLHLASSHLCQVGHSWGLFSIPLIFPVSFWSLLLKAIEVLKKKKYKNGDCLPLPHVFFVSLLSGWFCFVWSVSVILIISSSVSCPQSPAPL